MAHIPPITHVAPEPPRSPLPTNERLQGMVRYVLGSDKIVVPENSLLMSSDMSRVEKKQQERAQLFKGAQAALDTKSPHIEHSYESYPSVPDALAELESLKNLLKVSSQQFSDNYFFEEYPRGYKVSVPLNLVGYPVDIVSKTMIAPNHKDSRARTLVTETTFTPQEVMRSDLNPTSSELGND